MRKLQAAAAAIVGSVAFAVSPAPATDRASDPAGSVLVLGLGGSLNVLGTSSSDRLVIDRKPADAPWAPWVLSANRPIEIEGDCTLVSTKKVECPFSDLSINLVELQAGADRVRIAAGSYPDLLTWGMRGDDRLTGGRRKDYFKGGDGDDRVVGGSGKDRLEGDRGDDRLSGGDGADVLIGGPGRDQCAGGHDRDDRRQC